MLNFTQLVTVAAAVIVSASSASAAENSLTLHLIRSPGLDWSTPNGIAKSTIKNALKRRSWPIGHMTVEVRCQGRSFMSGMTQRYGDEDNRVVQKERQGLGVLFYNFDGKHQDNVAVTRAVNGMLNSGRLGFIKFLISDESCLQMEKFQKNFVAKKMEKNYGMLSRPLMGEGGGCAAYAMAYPTLGGFLEPWMIEQWSQYRRVPRSIVGGPLTGYKIPVLSLMTKSNARWGQENDSSFPLFFYDPDKIFDWAKAVHSGESAPGIENAGVIRRIPVTSGLVGFPIEGGNTAFAIEIDRRNSAPNAGSSFQLEQRDPVEPIQNSKALDDWWSGEIGAHLQSRASR